MLETVDSGVIAADEQGRIAFANEAAAAVGRPPPVGTPLSHLMPPRLRDSHEVGFRRCLDTGTSRLEGKTVRVPALDVAGREVEVDLTIRVFERPGGGRLVVANIRRSDDGGQSHLERTESASAVRAYQLV